MQRFLAPLLILLVVALALTGCATNAVVELPPSVLAADHQLTSGNARAAAQAYAEQATTANGALRDLLEVRAADAWQIAGENGSARLAFARVNPKRLTGADAIRWHLLDAEFAIADGHADQAVATMRIADAAIPPSLRARWHATHANVLEVVGDRFGAAAQLALLEHAQSRRDAAATRKHIGKLLGALDDATLAQDSASLPPGHPLYLYAGRMLTARGLPLPHPYARGAGFMGDESRAPADADGYRPPNKIALLLPSSGPVAIAATAVRDGFMTAYYAESRRRPELRMYDSASSTGGAIAAYRKAVDDGNELIVGPLDREQVGALFELSDLPVPVLALNHPTQPAPPGSASFALAPEDEGVAAAQRLLAKGARRVIAFTAKDENATRALAAFREAYAQRGGAIVAESVISDAGPDYAPKLHTALEKSGGAYDGIFLALKAPAARLLASQLPANGFREVPRVSTSLILSGGGNARLDQELDGIEYPELAWLLHPVVGLPDASGLGARLPSARGGGARLFAFGADAFALATHLEALANDPQASVRGATGELSLDGFGNVVRDPAWAVFSGGRAHPVQDGALRIEPAHQ